MLQWDSTLSICFRHTDRLMDQKEGYVCACVCVHVSVVGKWAVITEDLMGETSGCSLDWEIQNPITNHARMMSFSSYYPGFPGMPHFPINPQPPLVFPRVTHTHILTHTHYIKEINSSIQSQQSTNISLDDITPSHTLPYSVANLRFLKSAFSAFYLFWL